MVWAALCLCPANFYRSHTLNKLDRARATDLRGQGYSTEIADSITFFSYVLVYRHYEMMIRPTEKIIRKIEDGTILFITARQITAK